MSVINTTNFLLIADNVAKTLRDLETSLITNVGANAQTLSTIQNGQNAVSNSLLAHVAALGDAGQENALVPAAVATAALSANIPVFALSGLWANWKSLFLALDNHVSGVNAYLQTNTLQVDPYFSDAFNYVANNAAALGVASSNLTPIAIAHIFPKVEVSLGTISVTGASAGTFGAGTALDTTKYASQQLYLKNTSGSPTSGTATSFTITYTNASGTTGQTVTQALSGALAAGAYLAAGSAVGQAVSNIVVNSGGVNADALAVVVKPLRAVVY